MTHNNNSTLNLSPEKIAFINELKQNLKTTPKSNFVSNLLTLTTKIKSSNITFSQEELNYLEQIYTRNLSSKDKQKFQMLKKLIEK